MPTDPTLDRKQFLSGLAATGAALAAGPLGAASPKPAKRPRAITMWDFSWLERRWPGAGYEDWDRALDQLGERGYDAVRIEAYPQLVAADPRREWLLKPEWNTQDWGSPTLTRVRVIPALYEFMGKCRDRGMKVGLSTWHRQDADNLRRRIAGPEQLAENWRRTLDGIKQAGLYDSILYVDMNNEFPGPAWAPYLQPAMDYTDWPLPRAVAFMCTALAALRRTHGDLPLLFSTVEPATPWPPGTVSAFDALDQHFWMAQANGSEFYKQVGYQYDRFADTSYHNLQLNGERVFRERPDHWRKVMLDGIAVIAEQGRRAGKPLMTTEGWSLVDYKDWPLLDWGYVKDLTAEAALVASATGRWLAIATSNFCGPQFDGMWRDVAWHQRLTTAIKRGAIDPTLRHGKLWHRL